MTKEKSFFQLYICNKVFFCLNALILLSSCTKNLEVNNIELPNYEPHFALPLLSTTTSVAQILENANPNEYTVNASSGLVTFNSNLSAQSTHFYDLDLTDIGEAIVSMEYKFVVENGTPLQGSGQLYFLNSAGETIDSLLNAEQKNIEPALVDANGNVLQASYQQIYVPFDSLQVVKLKKTTQVKVYSNFDANNSGGNVYTTQNVNLRLGATVVFDL